MVRRRESGHGAVLVVGGEPGDAAHFAERARVEEQFDALPAGQLAAAALAHHTRVLRPRREPFEGQAAHGGHVLQQRRPRLPRRCLRRVRPGPVRGCEQRHDLSRRDRVARPEWLQRRDDAVAGRAHDRLHLHRADDEHGIPRAERIAGRGFDRDDGSRQRTRHRHVVRSRLERGERGRVRLRSPAARAVVTMAGPHRSTGLKQRQRAPVRRLGRSKQLRFLRQQRGPGIPRTYVRVGQDRLELRQVGRDAGDVEFRERTAGALHGRGQGSLGGGRADHLGEERVELRRRGVSRVAAGVHPDASAGRLLVCIERPRALRHHARLDRVPAGDGRRLRETERRERRPGRQQELRLHEVHAGDLLRHRMLHLDARVGLDEEVLVPLGRHQELDRARIDVLPGLRQRDGIGQHALAQPLREPRGRCGLEDLLVAQLHGTVAFTEVYDVSAGVAEHLHLDVARTRDEAFHEHGAAAERAFRLAPAPLERFGHAGRRLDDPHAAPAAAGRRLEHHGITDRRGDFLRLPRGSEGPGAARHHRDVERAGEGPRQQLVAEQRQRRRRGAHERQARRRAALRERGVLREKTVARMHAVAAARERHLDQRVRVEVRGDRIPAGRADLAYVRRHPRVQRESVFRRMDRNRVHAETGRSPRDTNRDLAAVGDEHPFE